MPHRVKEWKGWLVSAFLSLVGPVGVASGQTPSGSTQAVPDEQWSVSVEYERHVDRLRYSFENPSTIGTPFLVPHTFAQTYWLDNHWLTARARYHAIGYVFTTEFGLTPPVTARASDIDTFYNPGNDVVISGTDGDAGLRSWRLAQWSDGDLWGVPLKAGYRYRRDQANYLPADVVLTHSNPVSETRRLTTDNEFVTSQQYELTVLTMRSKRFNPQWRMTVTGGGSPLLFARLSTRLPQKYPGQTIVADAKAAAVTARVEFERGASTRPLKLGVEWGKSVSYRASRSVSRNTLELSLGVVWRRQ